MSLYEGKTAVVTAASSGIGRAIAERLIAEGARVVATSRNGADALAEQLGERCVSMHVDITDESQIAAMIEATSRRFGAIDAAFNVANQSSFGTILGSTAAEWKTAFDGTVIGTFNCVRLQARHMIQQGVQGSIVNVASINADMPAWGLSSYAAAKAAVVMLVRACSVEFAHHGIRVNALSPGLTATPANAAMSQPMTDAFLGRIPLRRAATPEEQANAALFLGSSQASYISGENLVVDGGWANTGYPDTRPWLQPLLDEKLDGPMDPW